MSSTCSGIDLGDARRVDLIDKLSETLAIDECGKKSFPLRCVEIGQRTRVDVIVKLLSAGPLLSRYVERAFSACGPPLAILTPGDALISPKGLSVKNISSAVKWLLHVRANGKDGKALFLDVDGRRDLKFATADKNRPNGPS